MHPFPHRYSASASGLAAGNIGVDSPGLVHLKTAAPAEFGGPGDLWSPETLLCAAIADCFILTFRAVARAAKLDWIGLDCTVEGTLEKAEGGLRFTRYVTHAFLRLPPDADAGKAEALLGKAEHGCLVANSLNGSRELVVSITQGEPA